MKQYNIEEIEKSFEVYKEVVKEIKEELKKSPARYAKLAGYSRQSIHFFINSPDSSKTRREDPKRVLHLYKVIQEAQNENR